MVDLNALAAANAKRWANAELIRKKEAGSIALRLCQAKKRYQIVEAETGVPWPVIAVIHERESSQDWSASLAQGDPWDRISVHVPAGRGPFASWEAAAIDALVECPPYLARRKGWSVAEALTALETYNGIGYAVRGAPSPYLWAGTNQYRSGKYVRDGVYDPAKVDAQLGCAAVLKAMMALDPGLTFGGARTAAGAPPHGSAKSLDRPSVFHPSKGSIGAFAAKLISIIFGRK